MGFRFRKSVKIAPGVRVNFGKKSASVSIGGKGARYTVSSTGRKTASVGIPGTGISYSQSTGTKHRQTVARKTTPIPAYSPKTYKICSVIIKVLCIPLIIMSLLLLLAVPVGGIIGIAFGAFGLYMSKKYKQMSIQKPTTPAPIESTPQNNNLLEWQRVLTADSPDTLIYTKSQLQSLSNERIENDLKIVQDCMRLVGDTTNAETFFTRLALLEERAKDMVLFEPYVAFTGANPSEALVDMQSDKQEAIYRFLIRYYSSSKIKMDSLKTEKGRYNQLQRALEGLQPYIYLMDDRNKNYVETKFCSASVPLAVPQEIT